MLYLVTAKQAVHIYGFAGMTKEKLPRKEQITILLSPIDSGVYFRVTATKLHATYGGLLFAIEHVTL